MRYRTDGFARARALARARARGLERRAEAAHGHAHAQAHAQGLLVVGLIVLGLLGWAEIGIAQGLPPAPGEIAALEWLVGEWEGEGWIDQGGRRGEFRGTERVEKRMGGRLVVVEGSFTAFMGPQLGDVPVHQAFGIFSWDADAGGYVFRTYTARGGSGEANAAEVSDGRVVWSYEDPAMGTVRYTTTRTADGAWREEGHASRDGETWVQFFEMALTRRDATRP